MMRFSFLYLLICVSVTFGIVRGQSVQLPQQNEIEKTLIIEWQEIRNDKGEKVLVPIDGALNNQGLPFIKLPLLSLAPGSKISSATITDIEFVDVELGEGEFNEEQLKRIPAELSEMIRFSTSVSRGVHKGIITLIPVIKEKNGTVKRVKSLKYSYMVSRMGSQIQRRGRSYVASSVLASGSGDWYKVSVTETGMFKIDRAFLQTMGIDANSVDPGHVHVFGNSAGLLPELNGSYRPDDLLQHNVLVSGSGDGSFDQGDYVVFYAKSPHNWSLNGSLFEHQLHLFDTKSVYFININSARPSKTVPMQSTSVLPVTHTVDSFNDYTFYEVDKTNFIKSGREWYGDHYDVVTTYTYNFPFSNITDMAHVKARVLANSVSQSSDFTLTVNGSPSSVNINLDPVGSSSYASKAAIKAVTHSFVPSGNNINVSLTYLKPTASAQGWLDYLEINVRRQLTYTGNYMSFRDINSVGAGNIAQFTVNNAQGIQALWDVTDPVNAVLLDLPYGTSTQLVFGMPADTLREYIAFTTNSLSKPTFIAKVEHQDLHAFASPDMIILVQPELLTEASRLADFRRSEGLDVAVVTPEQVYNEFSSGMQDITAIREFCRMFYFRAGTDTSLMPKYLLLFGDGSYDNRGIRDPVKNMLLTYQSVQSLAVTSSHTSDDYFVILDDGEAMGNSDFLDMGVGRLPVSTLPAARNAVDKIIRYSTNTAPGLEFDCCSESTATMGDWRNVVCFIADDEDGNAYVNGCENMAAKIKSEHPEFIIDKIYVDAYQQVATPGGQRYPEAQDLIDRRVKKGALFVNYIGHGGELGWAHERFLDNSMINSWQNTFNLPVFMTATCEFTRFDDPERVSAGEYVFTNPDGGGAALFTTTRLVYSWPNEILNLQFIKKVLTRTGSDVTGVRLGDLLMYTKNETADSISGDNFRNFTLIGDPSMRIKRPAYKVVTDSINGLDIAVETDTLRALSKVRISGHLEHPVTGASLSGFNGYLYPTVYDKEAILRTLANDAGSYETNYNLWKNVVFKGLATVQNGSFSFEFMVPKDIGLQYGTGRVSYYSHDNTDDGIGYSQSFVIGGIDTTAESDSEGPELKVYLNEPSFGSGSTTSSSPVFVAELFDNNGINTVGLGLGHDITLVIDEATDKTLILNDFYQSDLNTFRSGKVKYNLSGLTPGNHILRFKAWDVHNNSSETTIDFIVAESDELALNHVLNYPNPFTTNTEFMFEHNQSCERLFVKVQIFTVSGKLVKTINEYVEPQGFRVRNVFWDGMDEYGDPLARGTYIYKITASDDLGNKADKIEKLVILR